VHLDDLAGLGERLDVTPDGLERHAEALSQIGDAAGAFVAQDRQDFGMSLGSIALASLP
jgi:hypothetical protein